MPPGTDACPRRRDEPELDITAPDVEVWADPLDGVDVLFHLAAEKYNCPGRPRKP